MLMIIGAALVIYGCMSKNDIFTVAGLAVLILNIYILFVREDKKKRKAAKEAEKEEPKKEPIPEEPIPEEPAPEEPAPAPAPEEPLEQPKPLEPVYQIEFNVAGVTFNCQKNRKEKRQDVIADMTEASPIELEEYEYRGKPAYLVIDSIADLDIGNVPKNIAAELYEKYDGYPVYADIVKIDTFMPDDGDEEIYFCTVRLTIY